MTQARPETEQPTLPDVLPVLPLRGTVIFPHAVAPLTIGQERSLRLVDDAMRANRLVALVAAKDAEKELPDADDIYRVGTAARILQLGRLPDGTVRVSVQGLERIEVREFTATDPYLVARIEPKPEHRRADAEIEGLRRAIIDLLRRLSGLLENLPSELPAVAEQVTDPLEIAYLGASLVPLDVEARQQILELDPIDVKMRRVVEVLQHEVAARELGRSITEQTRERITKANRDAMLREQLRSIQQELGESEENSEVADLRRRMEDAQLPEEARREVEREVDRLATIPEASPEHGLIRTWLDVMLSLPWGRLTGSEIEVPRARKVLDDDHYDLEDVKRRVLEYLAVRKLRQERRVTVGLDGGGRAAVEEPAPTVPDVGEEAGLGGEASPLPTTPRDEAAREPILCFVGPPGVGKTSLGHSIARALGRQFVRMSLGGVRDEAEIRGHRRTYIGALPGRVIQGIRRTEARDPVFMLDEIDKVGADWRGDPTSALLEVLDPAQNHTFVDNYLGVPFDLSQVLFIATANTLDTIPAPLLDRMEVLQIAGYTEEEKIRIAERYLLPQQIRAHGLTPDEVRVERDALRQVVRGYTREAGVRDLDRRIATICRKIAMQVAEATEGDGSTLQPAVVTTANLTEFLGRPRYLDEVSERTERPGIATGLAWTPSGGDVLFVEAAMIPDGEQPLLLTGMLGDVMRESAQAALTYVRSEALRFGIDPGVFTGKRLHIHVPAGALPKDGPSAGVTMVTAIASLAAGRPVREYVAMTGEITLRGKVLPVGGIKEKVLAAHRAGVRTVILPRRNEPDLDDVPEELRREMRFIPVDDAAEVLSEALGLSPAMAGRPSDDSAPRAADPAGTYLRAERPGS